MIFRNSVSLRVVDPFICLNNKFWIPLCWKSAADSLKTMHLKVLFMQFLIRWFLFLHRWNWHSVLNLQSSNIRWIFRLWQAFPTFRWTLWTRINPKIYSFILTKNWTHHISGSESPACNPSLSKKNNWPKASILNVTRLRFKINHFFSFHVILEVGLF